MKISILNYSELESSYKRLDAEYYQPIYLQLEEELRKHKTCKISCIAKVTDGEHGSVELLKHGIKYLTAENIKKGFVDTEKVRFVSKEVDERNKRARVCVGDVLVSIKGTLGEIAVAEPHLLPANMNRDVAIIKPKGEELISEYIAVFLMSRMGNLQAFREGSGGVQQMITLGRLGNIEIPVLSNSFQTLIQATFKRFSEYRNRSLIEYNTAENVLLTEVGLLDWRPKHKLAFVKSYSETLLKNRIDAEYYQPKYDEVTHAIKSYCGGWDALEDLVSLRDKNFKPDPEKEYKYIELSNISGNGEINGSTSELGGSLPTRARRKVTVGDVIVSSIEGSLSSTALVGHKYDQALCSTGFYVMHSDYFNSETLLVLMKSLVGQMLLKKGCSGTILTAINKDELSAIVLPKLKADTQLRIKKIITSSFVKRNKSRRLLNTAKKAVEMAIQHGEKTSLLWLRKELAGFEK